MGETRAVRLLCEWACLYGWRYRLTVCSEGRSMYVCFVSASDRFKVRISDHRSPVFKPDNVKRYAIRVGRDIWPSVRVVLMRLERPNVTSSQLVSRSIVAAAAAG